MDSVLASVGTIVLTTKTMQWVASLGYLIVIAACTVAAYILPRTEHFSGASVACTQYEGTMSALTQWVLYTNVLALLSAYSFFYFAKGSTVSVAGSLVWMLNFLQTIVLFFYVQAKVFNSDVRACQSYASESNSAFPRQITANLTYIIIQYIKIAILLVAFFYFRCCLKSKFLK